MFWNHELLLNKAQKYAVFAEENYKSSLRPLFASFVLELLGKSCLSKINPALVADPREGNNLLYACGIKVKPPFKSVVAKTVFERCHTVISAFDKDHWNFSVLLSETRNSELHSGEEAFDELPTSWEVNYYVVSEIFLDFLGKKIEDFFPKANTTSISKILSGYSKGVEGEVKKKIDACRIIFKQLEAVDQVERVSRSIQQIEALQKKIKNSTTAVCPSCASLGLITGEVTDFSDSKIENNEIVFDKRIFPTNFKCLVCDLNLKSYPELVSAGIGKTFIIQETQDPIEYFELNPREYISSEELDDMVQNYIDYDYGND